MQENLWSWNCDQLSSVQRCQSIHEYSESPRDDQPRFWIAGLYTEFDRYLRKRFFWRSTFLSVTRHYSSLSECVHSTSHSDQCLLSVPISVTSDPPQHSCRWLIVHGSRSNWKLFTSHTDYTLISHIPARCESSSELFEKPKNLASSSCGSRPGDTGKTMGQGEGVIREPQGCSTANSSLCKGSRPFYLVLEELILKIVWWKIRDIPFRNCISENSQTELIVSARRSISRPNYALTHSVPTITMPMDQRSGDGEIHRRSFDVAVTWRESFQPILKCLMGLWRLHWRIFSPNRTSEVESVLKRSALKNRSDFYEGGRLLTWSLTIFEYPVFMMQLKTIEIFSIFLTWRWHSRFQRKMGSSSISSKWNTSGEFLGGFYQRKIRDSVQLQTVLAGYDQEMDRDRAMPRPSEMEDGSNTTHS